LIVQLDPPATEDPQLLVCAKSPVTAMPEIVSGAFPVLKSVSP